MLFCPIRGFLAGRRKQDDLSESEELRRIEIVKLLLEKGYPKEHIDIRNVLLDPARGRRPSLRADVVVYDRPVAQARQHSGVARRRDCIRLIARVGRDQGDAALVKETQLRLALTVINRQDCVGLYWDDTQQCVLIKQLRGSSLQILERPISVLPVSSDGAAATGPSLLSVGLRHSDLRPATDLVKPFSRIEEILHQAGHSKEERHALMALLLLMKVRDEERAAPGNLHLVMQDFSSADLVDPQIRGELQQLLEEALRLHGACLPSWVEPGLTCASTTLSECCQVLSALSILDASEDVLRDFFVYFGRCLYKVDLGKYFTPFEVLDLIVQIINPRPGERLLDPACGTADFLLAAQRAEAAGDGKLGAQRQGMGQADLSVALSRFNMLLHGGQGGEISCGDSLTLLPALAEQYALVVCSPPFGVRMLEKRPEVLEHFALARQGAARGGYKPQEVGLLFVELCLRSVVPGGRVGLILPNGYLGNRSPHYVAFRRWLLCQARIVAVIGFPRFTFKRAGADVSASAVILERRAQPLATLAELTDYPIYFDLLDKVGWDLQSTPSTRLYKRNLHDGSLLRNSQGELILDADFDRVLQDLRASDVAQTFPWVLEGVEPASEAGPPRGSCGVPVSQISVREDLCLDPKRWCPKHARVVAALRNTEHFQIGEVLRPVVRPFKARRDVCYRYVEIENIYEAFAVYIPESRPGWALPRRARLRAAPGDIFIANIWSSAGKWMIAGAEAHDGCLVVTNGCTQFELIPGREALLPDLVFGLSSEAFKVQMRARASGSDGLSWITAEDMTSILLPHQPPSGTRPVIEQRLKDAYCGHLHLPSLVSEELAQIAPAVDIPQRSSHTVQV